MNISQKIRGDRATIELVGNISEDCEQDFLDLRSTIAAPNVDFDLTGLNYINSYGAARWIRFITELGKRARIEFHHCPINFVEYVGMVPSFRGGGKIVSLLVPYFCQGCGATEIQSCVSSAVLALGQLPEALCAKCGEAVLADVDGETVMNVLRA